MGGRAPRRECPVAQVERHRPRGASGQVYLRECLELTWGLSEVRSGSGDVDVQLGDVAPGSGSDVADPHRYGPPLDLQVRVAPASVGEAKPEGERRPYVLCVIPAVADEHALRVVDLHEGRIAE